MWEVVPMEFQAIADIIVRELKNEVAPNLVYIYGSYSSGRQRPESDIDVAYLGYKTLRNYERFMLAQRLASLLGRDVDLVDLRQASTVLQMQVVSKGRVVYCLDESYKQRYEMLIYKMYARLNEERQEVLLNYAPGGRPDV